MRICIIGDCSGNIDEGMKKTALYLNSELSKKHQVLLANPRTTFSQRFWRNIKHFEPQIVHYVPGPSIFSFMIVKALATYCRNTKTVMSALHPCFYGLRGLKYGPYNAISSISSNLIPIFKPDLILIQSSWSERMFTKLGCRTQRLPNGVDTDRFIPVSTTTRKELRKKYGINEDKFLICHVGSLKKWRNVSLLKKLQKENNQVLVVGSTSTGRDKKLCQELQQEENCLVWTDYVEDMEEIYALSDCYVFPTMEERIGSIEMPLSVLEAMSCNLPVISTKFGGLPEFFQEGDGLFFVNSEDDFHHGIKRVKNRDVEIRTRKQVLPYSWENIAERLENIYQQL
ncbi:MAG: glycosyltransferase family 4 protein [Candidatus Hodarchaeota archaeon]